MIEMLFSFYLPTYLITVDLIFNLGTETLK